MLLPGRLFLLILFRRWPARPPLALSSLLGGTLQLFDFLSYLQLCHFWLTLPKPRMFSSRSCRSFMYAYQETCLGAGLALRFWGSSATFGQFWEAGESTKKAGNHFPHNLSLYFAFPLRAPKRIPPHIFLAVEPLLSCVMGQLLTNTSYWKSRTKLSHLHFPLFSPPPPRASSKKEHKWLSLEMKLVAGKVLAALKIRQKKSAQASLKYRIAGDGQATLGFPRERSPSCTFLVQIKILVFHLGLFRPRLWLSLLSTWDLTAIRVQHWGLMGAIGTHCRWHISMNKMRRTDSQGSS